MPKYNSVLEGLQRVGNVIFHWQKNVSKPVKLWIGTICIVKCTLVILMYKIRQT